MIPNITRDTSYDDWRIGTNTVATNVGDPALLTKGVIDTADSYNMTDAVTAINSTIVNKVKRSGDTIANIIVTTTCAVGTNATVGGTLGVTGNVSVNGTKFNVTAATGATAIAGPTSITDTSASALTVNTNKFTVNGTSGNTLIAGTASITGDLAVNTTKFNVTAATGATAIAGPTSIADLSATALTVNSNKFIVNGTSGNTTVAGTLSVGSTLGVTGTSTLAAVNISGNIAVNTNTFNVTAASGNTTIAGTLGVTGNVTLSGTGNSVGTITSGVWNGTPLTAAYGGTGSLSLVANKILGVNTGGTAYEMKTIQSTGSSVTITYGAGYINLEASATAASSNITGTQSVGQQVLIGNSATFGASALEVRPFNGGGMTSLIIGRSSHVDGSSIVFNVTTAGNTTVAGTLGVTGAATFSSTLAANSISSTTSISGTGLSITSSDTVLGTTAPGSTVPAQKTEIGVSCVIATYLKQTNATTASQVIGRVPLGTYRSAEFIVQASDPTSSKWQSSTIKAIQTGASSVDYTEYASIGGNQCGSFVVSYVGGNMELQVTPTSANTTTFKVTAILTKQ